jgi:hypothetical protein
MNKIIKFLLIILTVSFFTSCNFISNTLKYKTSTKEFVSTLLDKNFNKSIEFMVVGPEIGSIDTLKSGLSNFRELIVKNFGEELEYTLMGTEKKFSTIKSENTPPNTTVVTLQISNKKEFGVLRFLFDDTSKKILQVNMLNVKEPVPHMLIFWLFGIFAVCVLIFNIYIIRRIKRSNLTKKWVKYVVVILLNVPTFICHTNGAITFALLNFQILLGISFSYMGYLNSFWSFGVPIGGLYCLFLLMKKDDEEYFSKLETENLVEVTELDNLKTEE